MNDCCPHNAACIWGVGASTGDAEPDSPVQHFDDWSEAFDALIALAEREGVPRRLLAWAEANVPPDRNLSLQGPAARAVWLIRIGQPTLN